MSGLFNSTDLNGPGKGLQRSFSDWDAGEPKNLWPELEADLDAADAPGNPSFAAAFEEWETEAPADNWEQLNESISIENVWNKLNTSVSEAAFDHSLNSSFEKWDVASPVSDWNKLDQSISVEQVWSRLNGSLAEPVATRVPWLKLAAACIVMIFVSTQLTDAPVQQISHSAGTARHLQTGETTVSSDGTASSAENPGNSLAFRGVGSLQTVPANADIARRNQGQHADNRNTGRDQVGEEPINGTGNQNIPSNLAELPSGSAERINNSYEIDRLNPNSISYDRNLAALALMPRKAPQERWVLQLGTQLSLMQDDERASLSTSVPRFGFAGDIAYRHSFGNIRFTGALGLSQYAQNQGEYINGRYLNSVQKINTLQLSAALGYDYRRFSVYGGVLFSNMLTALEQNGSTITQVYNFRTVEPGLTAGADYRLLYLSGNKNALGIGAQYQFIPGGSTGQSTLRQLHGMRIQLKFSF